MTPSLRFIAAIAISTLTIHAASSKESGRENERDFVEVYDSNTVDLAPQFPGGEVAMFNFINSERVYPCKAYREGIEGRVRCSFVVNTDGRISHISVIKGVESSLDREAVRVISEMPHWQAGVVDDRPVPVYCILSIPFRR